MVQTNIYSAVEQADGMRLIFIAIFWAIIWNDTKTKEILLIRFLRYKFYDFICCINSKEKTMDQF